MAHERSAGSLVVVLVRRSMEIEHGGRLPFDPPTMHACLVPGGKVRLFFELNYYWGARGKHAKLHDSVGGDASGPARDRASARSSGSSGLIGVQRSGLAAAAQVMRTHAQGAQRSPGHIGGPAGRAPPWSAERLSQGAESPQ